LLLPKNKSDMTQIATIAAAEMIIFFFIVIGKK
jgi:hypothetical protein